MVLALGQQQQQQLAQAAALEHLREKAAEGPDKTMARMAEEHQRLMQQAFQQNLLAMASHFSSMSHLKPSVAPGEPSAPPPCGGGSDSSVVGSDSSVVGSDFTAV